MADARRNLLLTIAYDGTCYAGWQRQQNAPTVQQTLEERLAVITGGPVLLHGAGRTDAGVHAHGMTAHFHTDSRVPVAGLLRGVNSMLPPDIRLIAARDVAASFHARFDALGKTYVYQLLWDEVMPPHLRLYWAHYRPLAHLPAMRECLAMLVGSHDFSTFEAAGSRDPAAAGRGAVRTIHAAAIAQVDSCRAVVEISGDGFLRHMVRNIVGTLAEVGQGRMSVADFAGVFRGRDRSLAGATAPPGGLFLKRVHYPQSPL